eukprot:TRINITY_DN81231_c0_g1_i1.p1 TRINITY_DN81231_c0_g1~~TRINITY_DN81231_c0_g1_i1.p1  ORF type:complete len:245 (+),score=21.03 TRINITY_DN81231_c0_g1_i1:116-850(+)
MMHDVDSLLAELDELGKSTSGQTPPATTPPASNPQPVVVRQIVDVADIESLLGDISVDSPPKQQPSTVQVTQKPVPSRVLEPLAPTKSEGLRAFDPDSDSDGDHHGLTHRPPSGPMPDTRQPFSPTNVPLGARVRCAKPKMGGTQWATGCSQTLIIDKKCDNMVCIKCDFKVSAFEHYRWSPSVSYIFLRNNVPDFEKLRVMLEFEQGSCAYACQCTSRTARELECIGAGPHSDVRWICAGHIE